MRRWVRRRRRADRPVAAPAATVSDEAPAPLSAPTPSAAAAALARPVIERLSEDEALRGDLTDAGFAPLLDWLTRLVTAAAERATTDPDSAATMERVGDAARQLGRAVVRAAERGDAGAVAAALAPPLLAPDEAERAASALPRLAGDTADDRARALVRALASVVPDGGGGA